MQCIEQVQFVSGELQDTSPAYTRYSKADLISFLNEGQRLIALLKPDSTAITTSIVLVAGTKQVLASQYLRLIDAVRNMGANGATPGLPVAVSDRLALDRIRPTWHTDTQASIITDVLYDEKNPQIFYCYPPATAAPVVQLELILSQSPIKCVADADPIALQDIYTSPLRHYMMYCAYARSAQSSVNWTKAQFHYGALQAELGVKIPRDLTVSPNISPRTVEGPTGR